MTIKEILVCVVLLLVGIAILVTIHICMAGRAFRRNNENNNNITNTDDIVQLRNIRRGSSMAEEEINKLPCFEYNVETVCVGEVECAVCLDSFKVGDVCRLLPNCMHNFHVHCIDSWLSEKGVCPICRTEAGLQKVERERTGSSEVGVGLV